MFATSRYASEVVRLEPSDLAVAMTDGITEGLENAGRDLHAVLRKALETPDGTPAPDRVTNALMAASEEGQGVGGWHDDRTVVALGVETIPKGDGTPVG